LDRHAIPKIDSHFYSSQLPREHDLQPIFRETVNFSYHEFVPFNEDAIRIEGFNAAEASDEGLRSRWLDYVANARRATARRLPASTLEAILQINAELNEELKSKADDTLK
jgi:hypothetical protein